MTGDARLDRYPVSDCQMCDFGADPDDFAGTFVAEDVSVIDVEVANLSCFPEVDIGSGINVLTRSRGRIFEVFTDPQMPFDLTRTTH